MERVLNIVSARDLPTRNHQRRVSVLAVHIGRQMGMQSRQIETIRNVGLLHDIGKVVFPPEFLVKKDGLSPLERQLVVTHPKVGYDMLDGLGFPETVRQAVLQHHEHIDGSGYPNGLKGPQILTEAKVVSVADVIDAITSNRSYNTSLNLVDAIHEITKNSGRYYEPAIVDAYLEMLKIQTMPSNQGYSMSQFPSTEIVLPW